MATNYPTNFDSYSAHADGVGETILAAHINALQDAVAALQVKVGKTSDPNTASLDYLVAHVAATAPYTYDPGSGASGLNAGSANLKGCMFVPSVNMTLTTMTHWLAGFNASATYQAWVLTLAGTGSTTVASVVGSSTILTMPATLTGATFGKLTCPFATPVALTSGVSYFLGISSPSGATTANNQQIVNASMGATLTIKDPPGVLGESCSIALGTPIVGTAATTFASTNVRVAPGFTCKA